jgi:hypothetical protein
MEKALRIVNSLQKSGVIKSYAIGGGIAATFYIEPVLTYDLDIFFVPSTEGMDVLSPLYRELRKKGCRTVKELVMIEGVAVQFIPVYNDLVKEAVETAVESTYKRVRARILRPEYLLVIALQTNRPKDRERAAMLLEQAKFNSKLLARLLSSYGLSERFQKLKA